MMMHRPLFVRNHQNPPPAHALIEGESALEVARGLHLHNKHSMDRFNSAYTDSMDALRRRREEEEEEEEEAAAAAEGGRKWRCRDAACPHELTMASVSRFVEEKPAMAEAKKSAAQKEAEMRTTPWDCGSSLYDSFELKAFSNEFGFCLAEELRSSATTTASKPLLHHENMVAPSSSLEWSTTTTTTDPRPSKRRRCRFLPSFGGGGSMFSVVPSCFRIAAGFEQLERAPVAVGSKRKAPALDPLSSSSSSSLPRVICHVSNAAKACLFPNNSFMAAAPDPRHYRHDAHLRHMVHHHHHHLLLRRHRHRHQSTRPHHSATPFLHEFTDGMAEEEDHEGEAVAAKLLKQFREDQARACISPRTLAAALQREMERQQSNLKYHIS